MNAAHYKASWNNEANQLSISVKHKHYQRTHGGTILPTKRPKSNKIRPKTKDHRARIWYLQANLKTNQTFYSPFAIDTHLPAMDDRFLNSKFFLIWLTEVL